MCVWPHYNICVFSNPITCYSFTIHLLIHSIRAHGKIFYCHSLEELSRYVLLDRLDIPDEVRMWVYILLFPFVCLLRACKECDNICHTFESAKVRMEHADRNYLIGKRAHMSIKCHVHAARVEYVIWRTSCHVHHHLSRSDLSYLLLINHQCVNCKLICPSPKWYQ